MTLAAARITGTPVDGSAEGVQWDLGGGKTQAAKCYIARIEAAWLTRTCRCGSSAAQLKKGNKLLWKHTGPFPFNTFIMLSGWPQSDTLYIFIWRFVYSTLT